MTKIALVVVLALAGCKDKDKAAEPAKTEPATTGSAKTEPAKTEPAKTEPAKPAGDKVLVIAPAKMTAEGEGQKAELAIDAAGKVTLDGKEVATITPAGELVTGDKVVATITKDGEMNLVGEAEKNVIREDGAMLGPDGKVALEPGPDGVLTGPLAETELKGMKIRLEGDKAGYRGLLFAWLGVSQTSK